MRESRPPGCVRGASSNGCPYRDRSEISSWMRVTTLVSKAKSCATRQPMFRARSSRPFGEVVGILFSNFLDVANRLCDALLVALRILFFNTNAG